MKKLYVKKHMDSGSKETLVLLHGLFGAQANWGLVTRQLDKFYKILVPDLRNHGQSFHTEEISYKAMANDVFSLLEDEGIKNPIVIGHSMGGKVAMAMALMQPKSIQAIVVIDIAPMRYANTFGSIYAGLNAMPLVELQGRKQADTEMAKYISDAAVRAFLMQNLIKKDDQWQWRLNLAALEKNMAMIGGFDLMDYPSASMPAQFIYGENSNYVNDEAKAEVEKLFKKGQFSSVEGAGHWVYAEQPEIFMQKLLIFLNEVTGHSV